MQPVQAVSKNSEGAKPGQDVRAKAEIPPLKRGDASLLEISANAWKVIVPRGVQPKELELHPTFWNLLSEDFREGDSIKALWMDRSWVAKYEVVSVNFGSVQVRLAYAVAGAPLVAAGSPKAFPAGYHIEKTGPQELQGFVVIRESDGFRIMNGGQPWRTFQDAHEQFPKSAIFHTDHPTMRLP